MPSGGKRPGAGRPRLLIRPEIGPKESVRSADLKQAAKIKKAAAPPPPKDEAKQPAVVRQAAPRSPDFDSLDSLRTVAKMFLSLAAAEREAMKDNPAHNPKALIDHLRDASKVLGAIVPYEFPALRSIEVTQKKAPTDLSRLSDAELELLERIRRGPDPAVGRDPGGVGPSTH